MCTERIHVYREDDDGSACRWHDHFDPEVIEEQRQDEGRRDQRRGHEEHRVEQPGAKLARAPDSTHQVHAPLSPLALESQAHSLSMQPCPATCSVTAQSWPGTQLRSTGVPFLRVLPG
jgi:hypothetical protein